MQHPIESFVHGGFTANIFQDEDVLNPRKEQDPFGRMVCFHNRYRLGEEHGFRQSDYSSWEEVEAALRERYDVALILPLGLIDHGGISMYIGAGAHSSDPSGWDSGQVGFVFCTREQVEKEWGSTPTVVNGESYDPIEMAERVLKSEVETYNSYLLGDVYGYEIEDSDGSTVDSCWGYYGFEYVVEESKRVCESLALAASLPPP
jgi:hypothetical protein